jgi:hypothetical protein
MEGPDDEVESEPVTFETTRRRCGKSSVTCIRIGFVSAPRKLRCCGVGLLVGGVFLIIVFSFVRLWIQSFLTV